MPVLVGSDLRADRGLGSRTSPTGSPSEVPPSHEGNRHKRTQRSRRDVVIEGKQASGQSRVGLPENRSLTPLRSLRSFQELLVKALSINGRLGDPPLPRALLLRLALRLGLAESGRARPRGRG